MSNNQPSGITTQEYNNARQSLKLLALQVKKGTVDGAFLQQQIERLQTLFERMEVDLQQARRTRRFEALYQISQMLGTSLDLDVVLEQVMEAILKLTGAERGFLMMYDHDGGFQIRTARQLDEDTIDSSQFQYSRTIANEVIDTGQAVVTTNAVEDARYAGQASIVAQSLRSIMAVPLRIRGSVAGVAYVDSRIINDMFNADDLNAMQALAGQAAIAIENAQLFEQTDQQLAATVAELRQLRRFDRQLNETLETDRAVEITLNWAVKLAGADHGYLGMVEGNPPIVPAMRRVSDDSTDSDPLRLDVAYPGVKTVLETGKPLAGAVQHDDERVQALILPLRREAKVLGVVVLCSHDDKPYTEGEIDLAERLVDRAAITIQNARLYADVQAADRAKSEFVGIVAHDLKVPMTSIMGYAHLTKMIGDEHNNFVDRQAEFLDRISDTVNRMEILVSDLADISRIESGHFRMDNIRVSVEQIAAGVRDNTITQIEARGHTYVEEVPPRLPQLYVDYYRLLQVLTNLISNAYKYTPDGGTITLKVAHDGSRVRFSVSDTGIGLSNEQIAQLGTKFWRAHDTYTRSQPGTGLGFAITANLVALMGSEIEIHSEKGVGSTFSFTVATATDEFDPDATNPLL
jgi:K+-sensing histidine kinase KdpD